MNIKVLPFQVKQKLHTIRRLPFIHTKSHFSAFIIIGLTLTNRGGFKGGRTRCAPPLFFAEIGRLTLCGRPQAKRMHQIVQIDFENYKFSPLLRGHILLTPPQAPKFCQSLILAPLLLKILDPPLTNHLIFQATQTCKSSTLLQSCSCSCLNIFSTKSRSLFYRWMSAFGIL